MYCDWSKRLVMLAAIAPVALADSAQPTSDQCGTLTFEETFDGVSLNANVWNVVSGNGCEQDLCGWGNNELESYDAENLQVKVGHLIITAKMHTESPRYTSAKITTEHHFSQRYGRFEARMKLPAGKGLWPAFWLLPQGSEHPWPVDGEIDILEATGDMPERILGAAHFGQWPNHTHYSETLRQASPATGEFHVYAIDWEPGKITWSVDNKVYGVMTPADVEPWEWVFDRKPFYVILNMAIGGTLGGPVDDTIFPAELAVDYVRVYSEPCN